MARSAISRTHWLALLLGTGMTLGCGGGANETSEGSPPPLESPGSPAPAVSAATLKFQETLNQADDLAKQGDHEGCLERALGVKKEMLETSDSVDPYLLGWSMIFEFKALYHLGKYAKALAVAEQSLSKPWMINATNLGYRYSVCAELVVRTGGPVEDLLAYGEKALQQRESKKDARSILQVCQTICYLLQLRDAEDRNEPFARRLVKLGKDMGADAVIARGYGYLIDGSARRRDGAALPGLKAEFERDLEGVAESPQGKAEKEAILLRFAGKETPGSNSAALQEFLKSNP